jgi:ParD-like antitoxin of type II bacterial toxin-antitoxin system
MSSNSVRIGADLFEAARAEGALQSRSTAQQIEHWAKLGAALESCGLTVGQVASLLRASHQGAGDADLWAFKRQNQLRDMASAAQGKVTQQQLSWFAGGKARGLKVIGSPY